MGMSIYGVYIGPAMGWDVEICAVLWSHSLALRRELLVFISPTLNLVHSIYCHPSPKRSCILFLVNIADG